MLAGEWVCWAAQSLMLEFSKYLIKSVSGAFEEINPVLKVGGALTAIASVTVAVLMPPLAPVAFQVASAGALAMTSGAAAERRKKDAISKAEREALETAAKATQEREKAAKEAGEKSDAGRRETLQTLIRAETDLQIATQTYHLGLVAELRRRKTQEAWVAFCAFIASSAVAAVLAWLIYEQYLALSLAIGAAVFYVGFMRFVRVDDGSLSDRKSDDSSLWGGNSKDKDPPPLAPPTSAATFKPADNVTKELVL